MAQELVDLKISKSINSMSNEILEYTPNTGKKVSINIFETAGENANNLSVQLIWKAGTEDEYLIWVMAPGGKMPFRFKLPDNEIDGTNKLCLKCENQNVDAKFLSAFVSLEVND